MPIQRTITLYLFHELSDKAKSRARDWWREVTSGDNDFADPVIEDFTQVCTRLGIDLKMGRDGTAEISWSGFSSQGDGFSFEGRYTRTSHAVAAMAEYAPQDEELRSIATDLDTDPAVSASIVRTSHHYAHERTVTITAFDNDDNEIPDAQTIVLDALYRLMRWAYRQLEREYDYRMADEQIDDSLHFNEYTFLETGERHD